MPTLSFRALSPTSPVESTYTYLYDWAAQHPQDPNAYVLEVPYQSAGRGQQGNSWYSSEGKNLLPSFLVRFPRFYAPMAWAVSELTALAVWEAVTPLVPSPELLRIKWPNDIYYGERKLAGILVGHSFSEMRINYSIIGVGLNVNERAFPSDLPNPISLYQIVGKELDLSLVRSLLYQSMEQRLGEIATLAPTLNMYHLDYLERLYKRDEQGTFRNAQTGREFVGIIRDVQPNGLLVRMVEDGLKHFAFKEIEYVHNL